LGIGVWGLRFRDWGLRLRVWSLGVGIRVEARDKWVLDSALVGDDLFARRVERDEPLATILKLSYCICGTNPSTLDIKKPGLTKSLPLNRLQEDLFASLVEGDEPLAVKLSSSSLLLSSLELSDTQSV